MNTRRGACRRGCSAFSSARAAATSGRSCSAACSVFFEADAVTLVEAPHRAGCGFQLLVGAKPRANLIERQIGLRRNEIEQPLAMLLKRRPGLASRLPGVVRRSSQRIAVEALTSSKRPASRALSPLSTIETARTRISFEYPLAIACPRRCRRRKQNLICAPEGIPCNCSDSHQAESALEDVAATAKEPWRPRPESNRGAQI